MGNCRTLWPKVSTYADSLKRVSGWITYMEELKITPESAVISLAQARESYADGTITLEDFEVLAAKWIAAGA